MQHSRPDFKTLMDYFDQAGLYNVKEFKSLHGEVRVENIEDIGTRLIVLAGMGKQKYQEGDMKHSYELFKQAELIVKNYEKQLNPEYIAFFYFMYQQLFSYFRDFDDTIRCIDTALKYTKSNVLIAQLNYGKMLHSSVPRNTVYFSELLSKVNKMKDEGKYGTYVVGLLRLGIEYSRNNDYTNAEKYYQLAFNKTKKHGLQHTEYNIHNAIGYLFIKKGQYKKGINYLKKYINGPDSYSTRTMMTENIAYAYYLMDEYALSAEGFIEAYNIAKLHGVIQQLPIQCYYLGKCYEFLNKQLQALTYYKMGYDHANELIDIGFSFTGERKLTIQTYVDYLEKATFRKIAHPSSENVFEFAIGKPWRIIISLFQYNLIMVHLLKSDNRKDFFNTLHINQSTFSSVKHKLTKEAFTIPNITDKEKRFDPVNRFEGLIHYIEENLLNLDWKEANTRFEKDVIRYLYQHYGFRKRRLEDVLKISYPSVWSKLKKIEGTE